ncbi:hypothetical protein PVAND_006484 [Polypedilum vanderplanki]|uniref:Uncharacterized protein n=1 Tax=Polypedilum vanderplanki TaxID=319348 RepID=A0A9J6C3S8_POLVA|nr:hypothetical protein PVAND_006484 [Polypedilum vanderplanki]
MITQRVREFLDNCDQIVNQAVFKSRENQDWRKFEMEMLSIELIVMEKMKKNCRAHLIGLHRIGLSTDSENVHLLLDIGDTYYDKADLEKYAGQILLLNEFMKVDENWKVLKVYLGSPAIKCVYKETNQVFLIIISNGYKAQLSKTIGHLFKIQSPEILNFYHFLRIYIIDLGEIRLKHFQIIIMIIFYLQKHDFLPSILDIQSGVREVLIDGTPVQCDSNRLLKHYHGTRKMNNYKDHIYPFFKFYKKFNFPQRIIDLHRAIDIKLEDYSCRSFWRFNVMNSVVLDFEQNASNTVREEDIEDFVELCIASCDLFRDY